MSGSTVDKEDNLEYDVGNLSAFDGNPVDTTNYKSNTKREDALYDLARDNVQLLMNRIFRLPTEPAPGHIGRLALLPEPVTKIPREKPVPKPKKPTKWEEFAKTKGIQKRKRSKMVFEEESGEYKRRYGYKRAGDQSDVWAIPAKANDDGSVDPWKKMENEKKERVANNKKKQTKNNLRAAKGNRLPGAIDLMSAVSSHTKAAASKKNKKEPGSRMVLNRSKVPVNKDNSHVDVALAITQHSTASMGRFDKERHNEPAKKKVQFKKKEVVADVRAEKAKSMGIFDKMFGGAGSGVGDRFDMGKAANLAQAAGDKERMRKRQRK